MKHPYADLPDRQFWKRAVSDQAWGELSLMERGKFRIEPGDRIATAGSCFAQHINRYLRMNGRDILLAEKAHPIIPRSKVEALGYGQFPARYGNIYTVRQLVELFDQAMGRREMIEDFAVTGDTVHDLLRPVAVPDGFSSLEEARADRRFHLGCVRTMFESASVFIFTLGLTETWHNVRGDHVYPSCPGTVQGVYDPEKHRFVNFTFEQIRKDLVHFIVELRKVNPGIKFILTVSPVALAATYEDQHVLLASSHSKAVLRAVCGEVEREFPEVDYFPSYEIISSPCSFGQYLDADLRGVSERGVRHVMSCFFRTYFSGTASPVPVKPDGPDRVADHQRLSEALAAVECEELLNDPSQRPG